MKFIWLFGENTGSTHNNNSYYFWNFVVDINDEIEKYLVLEKNAKNKEFYNSLDSHKQKYIIWRNSLKHFKLFKMADMYFVSLSYLDITPEYLFNKKIKLTIKRPLVYLQHGVTAMKKLGYKGNTYWNNMFNFVYYNKEMKEKFIHQNSFKEYQLYYGKVFPRYQKMVEYYLNKDNKNKKILFFITWREYFGDNFVTKKFINSLNNIFNDSQFNEYINNNNIDVNLCLHPFFDDKKINILQKTLKNGSVKLVRPSEINLMKELATCDLLVTDYSSVAFDSSFLKIPVILYQPDIDEYFKHRDSYYSINELKKYNIEKPSELIDVIVNEKYSLNDFFIEKLPKKVKYTDVIKGKYILEMYNHYKEKQKNRITIVGYNFTGRGGSVNASKALAESLLEKGYLVEFISLRMTEKNYTLPCGMAINGFYNTRQNKWINRYKRRFPVRKKYQSYFKYDINKRLLNPYIGKALIKYLKNCNSKTIISTRESLHLFIKKYANVQNKIYYFHTDSKVLEDYYPGLLDEIKKERLENVVFVTNSSKEAYENDLDYNNYDNYSIIGNSLISTSMIKKEFVRINRKRKEIYATVLMRLSADRENDINNILEFGKYLKSINDKKVLIKVYGGGDFARKFVDLIFENNLEDHLIYCGVTNNSKATILLNDCVIDFCDNQSFGMPYIESIFNGKPVFAKENVGSLEVLKEIPNSYYHSNEELYTKLLNVKKKSVVEYKNNYEIISKKYSRKKIAEEIEKIINK